MEIEAGRWALIFVTGLRTDLTNVDRLPPVFSGCLTGCTFQGGDEPIQIGGKQ